MTTTFADVGAFVAKEAPLVGEALTGPVGIVGAVGSLLAQIFGADKTNPEQILQKIQADPDAAIKLQEFQANTKVQLQQIALQNKLAENAAIALDNQERASARQREEILAQAGAKDNTPRILAYIITVSFFITVLIVIFYPIGDTQLKDVLMMMLGILGGGWTTVIGYYFGSSTGSKSKEAAFISNANSKKS